MSSDTTGFHKYIWFIPGHNAPLPHATHPEYHVEDDESPLAKAQADISILKQTLPYHHVNQPVPSEGNSLL